MVPRKWQCFKIPVRPSKQFRKSKSKIEMLSLSRVVPGILDEVSRTESKCENIIQAKNNGEHNLPAVHNCARIPTI